jgi:lipoprotein-anchoring transpeptidase ErfK/SrfK
MKTKGTHQLWYLCLVALWVIGIQVDALAEAQKMHTDNSPAISAEREEQPERGDDSKAEADIPLKKKKPTFNESQQKTERKRVKKKHVRTKKNDLFITRIEVDLTAQMLTITWSEGEPQQGRHIISSGRGRPGTKDEPCKEPNKADSWCTGIGDYKPQFLTGENYRSCRGDSMKWYVEYDAKRNIGFHGGQRVTGKPLSHGCVRVKNDVAKLIHEHITEETEIQIRGKAATQVWGAEKRAIRQPHKEK